jgi:ubiquinone/menaquinone biosynthesis C-methylase UbiE
MASGPAPASSPERATGWLHRLRSRQLNGWFADQLQVQPYQHLLEIGFGTGHLLEEVARTLRIGFLAGIESSIPFYQQAYRRNKRFVEPQLMQLHLGELQELPYPAHYFHTVYSTASLLSVKHPVIELHRLTRMLRSRGRLVLLFRPRSTRKDAGIRALAEKMHQDYVSAGLLHTELEYRETAFGICLAVTGFTA